MVETLEGEPIRCRLAPAPRFHPVRINTRHLIPFQGYGFHALAKHNSRQSQEETDIYRFRFSKSSAGCECEKCSQTPGYHKRANNFALEWLRKCSNNPSNRDRIEHDREPNEHHEAPIC